MNDDTGIYLIEKFSKKAIYCQMLEKLGFANMGNFLQITTDILTS